VDELLSGSLDLTLEQELSRGGLQSGWHLVGVAVQDAHLGIGTVAADAVDLAAIGVDLRLVRRAAGIGGGQLFEPLPFLARHPRIVAYFGVWKQIGRRFGHQHSDQIYRALELQVADVEAAF